MAAAVTASARSISVHPWVRFMGRRILRLLISLWALVTFSFLIIHLVPGDPIRKALGINASASLVEATRHSLGLDQPIYEQYWHYLQHLGHGDFGSSLATGLPVKSTITDLLPNTLFLAVLAFVVTIAMAIPMGLAMAILTQNGRHRRTELVYTAGSIVVGAIPEFLLAVALVYLLAIRVRIFPIAGESGPASFVLPVASLSLGAIVGIARIVRVETLSVLDADFIRTARLKRLRGWKVYLRHALPNALTATVTIAGLLLGGLISGTILVETIFAWPGLGQSLVKAVTGSDYPMTEALVLVYGGLVLIINFAVDVLLSVIDPQSTIRES